MTNKPLEVAHSYYYVHIITNCINIIFNSVLLMQGCESTDKFSNYVQIISNYARIHCNYVQIISNVVF